MKSGKSDAICPSAQKKAAICFRMAACILRVVRSGNLSSIAVAIAHIAVPGIHISTGVRRSRVTSAHVRVQVGSCGHVAVVIRGGAGGAVRRHGRIRIHVAHVRITHVRIRVAAGAGHQTGRHDAENRTDKDLIHRNLLFFGRQTVISGLYSSPS
jgi:hypothetical protein